MILSIVLVAAFSLAGTSSAVNRALAALLQNQMAQEDRRPDEPP